jgi:hypothetical protein
MPIPVQFVAHAHQTIDALERGETYLILDQAMEMANLTLDSEGAKVIFLQQLSPKPPESPQSLDVRYNMLLGIQMGGQEEPIDMIDMKALDETSVKSAEDLAQEIGAKVKQHLAAKKMKGMVISSSGSKIDTRGLKNHHVSIDEADFLLVDGHRLAIQTENKEFWVLRAPVFRSYTISRWVNEGNYIRAFDDYDLVRKNGKGMLIDCSKVHRLAVEQLVERSRGAAKSDSGEYFLVERDEMTPHALKRFYTILSEIPSP